MLLSQCKKNPGVFHRLKNVIIINNNNDNDNNNNNNNNNKFRLI